MEAQIKVKEFCEKNKMKYDAEQHALDLMSEVGEVSKEILKMTDYGKKKLSKNNDIEGELGDAMYSLLALANSMEIDMEKALDKVLEKYNRRIAKGSAGSEND